MKKIIKILTFMFLLCFTILANENDIVGNWLTPDGDYIKIYKEGNEFVGILEKLAEPIYPKGHVMAGKEKIDTENPDVTKQTRKVTGMKFLTGFVFKDNKYKDGKIYNPGDGKTYYCKMEIEKDTLKVRGSLDKLGLAGSTKIWKKLK